MKKIKKIEFIAFLLVLVVLGAAGVVNFFIEDDRLASNLKFSLKEKSRLIEKIFLNSINETTEAYNKKIESILKKEGVLEAFADRDREKLLRLVMPEYETLKRENPYLEVFHFHLPDNHSFLRMHKPKKFGDDLSSFRHAVVDTNKYKVKHKGFETGIYGVFQRVIHPVFNKYGKHIGSLEIGLYVDHFIEKAKYILPDSKQVVLIKKSALVDKKKALYSIVAETENYVVIERYANDFFQNGFLDYFEDGEPEILEKGEDFFIPINGLDFNDFKENPVSKIGIFMNVTNEVRDYKENIKKSLLVLIAMLGVIFILLLIIFYTFNKKIAAQYVEILRKDARLHELNKNLNHRVSEQIEKIREQEQILFHQSKMALMGEMMNAIAHQWRQPLNIVALLIQDIEDAYAFNEIDKEYIKKTTDSSMKQINFLSNTIESFKNFFKQDAIKNSFFILDSLKEIHSLLHIQFSEHNIDLLVNGDNFEIVGYKNELSQIILNIVNNSKDAITAIQKESPEYKGIITIKAEATEESIQITIDDNGGGVKKEIIDRIFEPYFTTKFQNQGTGMGLFVSKMIIEQRHNGKIKVENRENGLRTTITF